MAGLAGVGGKAEWSAAMLGNSSCPRPLALLADLDRAAKVLGTRFARLACFPMGRKHPQGAVMRLSRFSRLARALRERPRSPSRVRVRVRARGLTTKGYIYISRLTTRGSTVHVRAREGWGTKNAARCGWREGLGRVHFLGPFFGSVNAGAIPCEPSRQVDFS